MGCDTWQAKKSLDMEKEKTSESYKGGKIKRNKYNNKNRNV